MRAFAGMVKPVLLHEYSSENAEKQQSGRFFASKATLLPVGSL